MKSCRIKSSSHCNKLIIYNYHAKNSLLCRRDNANTFFVSFLYIQSVKCQLSYTLPCILVLAKKTTSSKRLLLSSTRSLMFISTDVIFCFCQLIQQESFTKQLLTAKLPQAPMSIMQLYTAICLFYFTRIW